LPPAIAYRPLSQGSSSFQQQKIFFQSPTVPQFCVNFELNKLLKELENLDLPKKFCIFAFAIRQRKTML